jgi:hypothetical protein
MKMPELTVPRILLWVTLAAVMSAVIDFARNFL